MQVGPLVTGFGQIVMVHNTGLGSNVVFDVTEDFDGFDPFEGAAYMLPNDAPTGGYVFTGTPQRVFDVSAGTHTFTLLAARPESTVSAAVFKVTLTAVFYPNS